VVVVPEQAEGAEETPDAEKAEAEEQ